MSSFPKRYHLHRCECQTIQYDEAFQDNITSHLMLVCNLRKTSHQITVWWFSENGNNHHIQPLCICLLVGHFLEFAFLLMPITQLDKKLCNIEKYLADGNMLPTLNQQFRIDDRNLKVHWNYYFGFSTTNCIMMSILSKTTTTNDKSMYMYYNI